MDIDLEQLLTSDSVPDSTLIGAVNLLEQALPAYRRDLAYGLANIRRVEQKYKLTRDDIIRQDQALSLAKAEGAQDAIQIIMSDRRQNTQITAKLKQEYEVLTRDAQALKNKISATESHIQKIQAKRKNLETKSQAIKKRKYYYMALGVIDSSFLVNTIEYPVIQEAILQHSQLSVDVRIKFKPIEVAAFALNRLPNMYVTTMDDYHRQSRLVPETMKQRISDAVKRSIHSLRLGDPLHDSTPLPDEMFCEPAGLLGCLSLSFNRKDLRWSDVPKLLQKIKDQRSPVSSISPSSPTRHVRDSQVVHVQRYLQRSKLHQNNNEYDQEKSGKQGKIEDKFLELYTLRGRLKYVNAIEKLVVVQALFMMIDIYDETLNSAEILANTLNKLAPMYTTSERGLNQVCKHFFGNQALGINSQITKSYDQLHGQQRRKYDPLCYKQFNSEYQVAIPEIEKILNRHDLSPENLVNVIAEFVNAGS